MITIKYMLFLKGLPVEGAINRDRKNRDFVLKINAPFIYFISKINSVLIENAKDLDIVMPLYSLLMYVCIAEIT